MYWRDNVGVEENGELSSEENGWQGELDSSKRGSSTVAKELNGEQWKEGESKQHKEYQLKKLLVFEWRNWIAYIYSTALATKYFRCYCLNFCRKRSQFFVTLLAMTSFSSLLPTFSDELWFRHQNSIMNNLFCVIIFSDNCFLSLELPFSDEMIFIANTIQSNTYYDEMVRH